MEKQNLVAPYNLFHHILHFISDICCLESINLLYVDIVIIYIHNQECTIFLHQQDKEPLPQQIHFKTLNISLTETYLTNQTQIDLCPHKVESILLALNVAMFSHSAINSAAHNIYDMERLPIIPVV